MPLETQNNIVSLFFIFFVTWCLLFLKLVQYAHALKNTLKVWRNFHERWRFHIQYSGVALPDPDFDWTRPFGLSILVAASFYQPPIRLITSDKRALPSEFIFAVVIGNN